MRKACYFALALAIFGASDALASSAVSVVQSSFQPSVGRVEAGGGIDESGPQSIEFLDIQSKNRGFARAEAGRLGAYSAVDSRLALAVPLPEILDADVREITDLDQLTEAFAGFEDFITPNTAATSFAHVYFDRTLSLDLGGPASRYAELLHQYQETNGFDFDVELLIASVSVRTDFSMSLIGFDAGGAIVEGGFIESTTLGQLDLFVAGNRFDRRTTTPLVMSMSSRGFDTASATTLNGSTSLFAVEFDPLDGPFTSAQDLSVPITFRPDLNYLLLQSLTCSAQAQGGALLPNNSADDIASAICEASNSGYWNGLTDVRDLDGNPIADFRLTAASGFDYRFAHPDSPAPAAAPVPEPATWALLIGGFAMVGFAARRRQVVAA